MTLVRQIESDGVQSIAVRAARLNLAGYARGRVPAIVVLLLLAGCSGSGSSTDPGPDGRLQNTAPMISGTPQTTVDVGSVWSFQAAASDPDGDALQFSVENAPPWAAFDPATGLLSGTPETVDAGNYDGIRVTVSDGTVSVSLPAFSVSVQREAAEGLLALYTFSESSGERVRDRSGVAPALDLVIEDPELVSWLPGGGLEIADVTRIRSEGAAIKITSAIKQSNAFSAEVWVTPLSASQDGPARIVTISRDPFSRNFSLGQADTAISARFRTTETDQNGRPDLFTPAGVVSDALIHLVFTRTGDGTARVYQNGALAIEGKVDGDASAWNEDYALALGDEVSGGSRPWLGVYRQVALFDRALSDDEISQRFATGIDPNNRPPVADFSFSPDGGEAPVSVAFDGGASSDSDGRITRYEWDFGNGSSVVTTSPAASQRYRTPGPFTVQLSVTDDDGASSTLSRIVSVAEPVPRRANVRWTPPTTNTDGSPLTDLAGYTVWYGNAPGEYQNRISLPAQATSTRLTVTGSTLYVVVSAVNAAGVESAFSSELVVDTRTLDPA